jgi:hypothetical protein
MNALSGYQCGRCGKINYDYSIALNCCPYMTDVWVCQKCKRPYPIKYYAQAESCCQEKPGGEYDKGGV